MREELHEDCDCGECEDQPLPGKCVWCGRGPLTLAHLADLGVDTCTQNRCRDSE